MEWRKSSYSGYQNNCVECAFRKSSHSASGDCTEVAGCPDGVLVRDSKDPDGPRLSFSPEAWGEFVQRVKAA